MRLNFEKLSIYFKLYDNNNLYLINFIKNINKIRHPVQTINKRTIDIYIQMMSKKSKKEFEDEVASEFLSLKLECRGL